MKGQIVKNSSDLYFIRENFLNFIIYKTEMFEEYNIFPRNEYVHSDSESISNFKEDGSTYMGVKTIQEGTVADTNKKDLQNDGKRY